MKLKDKDLKKFYRIFNKAYFKNSLPKDTKVHFADDEELEKCDGEYIPGDNEILIHEDFKTHPDYATITLLHEMAHSAMPEYSGHGFRFGGIIDLLYRQGAYDDFL